MGLLTEGEALSWEETKKHAKHVQEHGIQQFINLYQKLKDRKNDELKWGDEIEYIIVHFNDAQRRAQLALRAHDLLPRLQQKELEAEERGEKDPDLPALWRPEMGAYMVESSPGKPFRCDFEEFTKVEGNMRARREEVQELLRDNEAILSVSAFPRLGCSGFTFPVAATDPQNPASILRSLFFPDEAIFFGHSRMKTVLGNLRRRRGRKPCFNVPLFKDKNTAETVEEDFEALGDDGEVQAAAKPGHIIMDSSGHGLGCCCLQVTFQARNLEESRFLYDQLAVMCAFMMTLTAAAPMYQGYMSDVDCRWDVLAASADDRTEEEMGLKPLKEDRYVISKSRYGSVDLYLSPEGDQYNDVPAVINDELFAKMVEAGVDAQLSKHIAKLFIRDPLILYSERIHQDDENESNHFENIQSTNWQSLRFKPPPVDSDIGWRVEFRPMETQLTDFECAAFVVFVVLLTRTIVSLKLNLLLPMSMVEENMSSSQKRNAVNEGRFWFRQHIVSGPDGNQESDKIVQMTVNEVFNGKDAEEGHFLGLVPLVEHYLASVDLEVHTKKTLQSYLQFISKKASGELLTTAGWMRKFVMEHPDYQQDSKVSESINYDLMQKCRDLSQGLIHDPQLLPDPAPPLSYDCQERMADGDTSKVLDTENSSDKK